MKKVLVTGGAGYIGSVLTRLLLKKNFKVRVFDNLKFGGDSLLGHFCDSNFEFLKGDVRVKADVEKALQNIDYVVHLASIVGDPACAEDPDLAKSTNVDGTKLLYETSLKLGVQRFIFASTCSNYGKQDEFVNENSKLSPVSLYAETKVEVEKYLLSQNKNNSCIPTCLRFSTVYGLSQRPRFDLTVNEFARESALGKELVIFGEQFWRPYCHVNDLARSVILVLESELNKVAFEVFNVGDTKENYQKKMIADELLKILPNAKIKYIEKKEDPRDYRVNFDKIKNQLGFEITKKVPDGLNEIIQTLTSGFYLNPEDSKYKNIK